MSITIEEIRADQFSVYAAIPTRFTVKSIFQAEVAQQ